MTHCPECKGNPRGVLLLENYVPCNTCGVKITFSTKQRELPPSNHVSAHEVGHAATTLRSDGARVLTERHKVPDASCTYTDVASAIVDDATTVKREVDRLEHQGVLRPPIAEQVRALNTPQGRHALKNTGEAEMRRIANMLGTYAEPTARLPLMRQGVITQLNTLWLQDVRRQLNTLCDEPLTEQRFAARMDAPGELELATISRRWEWVTTNPSGATRRLMLRKGWEPAKSPAEIEVGEQFVDELGRMQQVLEHRAGLLLVHVSGVGKIWRRPETMATELREGKLRRTA